MIIQYIFKYHSHFCINNKKEKMKYILEVMWFGAPPRALSSSRGIFPEQPCQSTAVDFGYPGIIYKQKKSFLIHLIVLLGVSKGNNLRLSLSVSRFFYWMDVLLYFKFTNSSSYQ